MSLDSKQFWIKVLRGHLFPNEPPQQLLPETLLQVTSLAEIREWLSKGRCSPWSNSILELHPMRGLPGDGEDTVRIDYG